MSRKPLTDTTEAQVRILESMARLGGEQFTIRQLCEAAARSTNAVVQALLRLERLDLVARRESSSRAYYLTAKGWAKVGRRPALLDDPDAVAAIELLRSRGYTGEAVASAWTQALDVIARREAPGA